VCVFMCVPCACVQVYVLRPSRSNIPTKAISWYDNFMNDHENEDANQNENELEREEGDVDLLLSKCRAKMETLRPQESRRRRLESDHSRRGQLSHFH